MRGGGRDVKTTFESEVVTAEVDADRVIAATGANRVSVLLAAKAVAERVIWDVP